MAKLENLKHFTAENQPANRGRKKGVPNRATVYKKILETKMKVTMPDKTQKVMTLYEAVALGQVQSAMKGNTNAWKEIQDSLYGKMTEKTELSGEVTTNVRKFSDAAKKIYGDSDSD